MHVYAYQSDTHALFFIIISIIHILFHYYLFKFKFFCSSCTAVVAHDAIKGGGEVEGKNVIDPSKLNNTCKNIVKYNTYQSLLGQCLQNFSAKTHYKAHEYYFYSILQHMRA